MDSNFSWVQTHKELAQYLADMEGRQKELIELLRECGVTAGLVDEDPEGNKFDLEEIDPFSFFCFIYKYGPENRLKVLQHLAEKLRLHHPEGESGIPSAQAQKVMMFPYKYHRENNEIKKLWEFFHSVLNDSVSNESFMEVLKIYGVGKVKITETLFYVDPENYFPINDPSKPYLKKVLGIDPNYSSWQEYLEILDKVKEKTDKPFYETSHEAWLWLEEQKKQDKKYAAFQGLVDRYKRFLTEESIENERYKWEAIYHFQESFDLEADDFTESLKTATSKAVNLVYQNSIGFIRKAVDYYPEAVREMFRNLYDESQPLTERFEVFVKASEELLPKVVEKHGKKLNHQQDERTISYYLTMRFPEKYPLYKNDTYKYLTSVLDGQDPKPAGEKFFHYLELADELIPVIESNPDAIDMVEEQLTDECFRGEQQLMVFQDILWINMRRIDKVNYWVFQGNPEVFDLKKALINDNVRTWRVNAHKSKITPGDKVILWSTGDQSGCYALAEVESEVYEDIVEEATVAYYKEPIADEPYSKVQLRITHNLANDPITEERVNSVEMLSGLNVGLQGTNFKATQQEYETLVDLVETAGDSKWNRLQATVLKIDHEVGTRKFFKAIRYVLQELNLTNDSPNYYAAAIDYYLHITIGSKYLIYLQIKDGDQELAFHVLKNQVDSLVSKYPDLRVETPEDSALDSVFVKLHPDKVDIDDFLSPVIDVGRLLVEKYSKSSYKKTYPEAYNPWIARVAMDDDLLEKLLNGGTTVNYPLNTIFYGPPGTGKTYKTIHRAAEIVEDRLIDDYDEAKEIFSRYLGDTIEFITFHQNYSYEDFIQGLRPDIENNHQLTFERTDGVFKKLADKALKNWKASEKPQTKKQSFEQVFNDFIQPLVEGEVEEIEVEMKRVSYFITAVTDKSIEFRKSSGNSVHTLSINTLRKMYEAESVMEIQGLSSYYTPLLNELLERGKSPGEIEVTERKNYVIIIDEINRANISRVFGELITLIEPDKRYGREHHIPAKLPSGEPFSVPGNLYIIGTMNTADKSIALLDIALRRRFEFEAMYPLYQITGADVYDSDVLEKINEKIVKLKGHDFQIGHSYFMSNSISLMDRMNRKVIPLLLEYFMNDEKEVRGILEYAGLDIEEKSWPLRINGMK